MNKNQMSSRLLGEPGANDTAVVTMADGTKIEIPNDVAGDLFSGNPDDDDDLSGDPGLLGDSDITYLGDLLAGNPKSRRKKSSFGSALRGKSTNVNLPAANQRPNSQTQAIANVIKSIPGAMLSSKSVSPLMPSHGLLNVTPTRAMIQGASLVDTFKRYETQYTGTSRTQVNVAASGNVAFTFALPNIAEGGTTTYCPAVLVQLGMQRQYSVPGAEVRIALIGVDETGTAIDARQWSVILPEGLASMFLVFVPFKEIASTVYPSIAKADAVNNLVVNLYALPTNTNTRVVLPGPDSSQYQYVKKLLGIAPQTEDLINTTQQ